VLKAGGETRLEVKAGSVEGEWFRGLERRACVPHPASSAGHAAGTPVCLDAADRRMAGCVCTCSSAAFSGTIQVLELGVY